MKPTVGYYVFLNVNNEFPLTIVTHLPSKLIEHRKHYLIVGVREKNEEEYEFKTGYLPYRIDRKNKLLLGERVDPAMLPMQVRKFIATLPIRRTIK